MTPPLRILISFILLCHVLLILSLARSSQRKERAARERRREFRRSLLNRR